MGSNSTFAGSMVVDETAFELPKLRVSFGFENDTRILTNEDATAEFWDVKFCNYQPLDQDPIFAAISKKHIVVCRLIQNSGDANPCQVIRVIRDEDEEASSCCCTWTVDPSTGRPLLCTGGVGAKIKIYDVLDGTLFACFVGHGGDVNDLVTSPQNPAIIASASDDTTVRIWSLDPVHRLQPCVGILAGEGHSGGLLAIAFHESGRYMLSGGHDQVINMWTVPDLPEESVSTPLQVHYPHFSSAAIHSGIVDCVAFYGDLILSRACYDNVIVLWSIVGFSSKDPAPTQSIAPIPVIVSPTNFGSLKHLTRSAFVPNVSAEVPQYTRLLSFHTPHCGPQFFMRFKLHWVVGQNPVLAFYNTTGNIFFWDLSRLALFKEMMENIKDPERDKSVPFRIPGWLKPGLPKRKQQPAQSGGDRLHRGNSERESTVPSVHTPQTEAIDTTPLPESAAAIKNGATPQVSTSLPGDIELLPDLVESWKGRYGIEDPHEPIKPHKTEASGASVLGRQVAWSPGGEWCVGVGSTNQVVILQRWRTKAKGVGP